MVDIATAQPGGPKTLTQHAPHALEPDDQAGSAAAADALITRAPPQIPTKRSQAESNLQEPGGGAPQPFAKGSGAEVDFVPYRRSISRGTVHYTMSPLMWTAKHLLTGVLRTMGAKLHRHTTQEGVVAVWEMKGKGTGPVTVLLHGLGGSSAEYFPPLSALRARCSRVISVDLPGHGHSEALGKQIAPGFTGVHAVEERMASALIQAVDKHLGDTPAHFIGHSLGGYMAAQVVRARRQKGIESRLLLDESDAAPWSAERLVQDRTHFSVPTFKSARHVAHCNYPQRPVLGWLYTPFLWARLASSEIQYLTHSDLKQPTLTPAVLGDLPEDTMVIVGRHDKFGTEDDVDYVMKHLPEGARLFRPDTGHGDIADAHPEILAIIDTFLALP